VIDSLLVSPDHLVGLEEEGWRNGQAECLSGLQVDDELKLVVLHK
jgi:hypothetical protein